MDPREAFEILNMPQSSSEEEIKLKYKELAKKHHPDVSKDPDANAKFAKINEAHKVANDFKAGKYNKSNIPFSGGFDPFQTGFNPFAGFQNFYRNENPQVQKPEIHLNINISFEESITGTNRKIEYSRSVSCAVCQGSGKIKINNGCSDCHGEGRSVVRQGNSTFITQCSKCFGHSPTKPCSCDNGSVNTQVSIEITISPGVTQENVLRLQGMGHQVAIGHLEMSQDAFVHILISESQMRKENNDVVSDLKLTFLEAILGKTTIVNTVYGEREITIPKRSRHNDKISLKNLGVKNTDGSHLVLLDVIYPENIEELIGEKHGIPSTM